MTQDELHQLFEYRDGRLHHRVASRGRKVGDAIGCINGTGYRRVGMHGRYYTEHSLVFLMFHGYVPSEIDHINGDRADNRIENLRAVTRSENQCNRGVLANNTSGYAGVSWHKKSKAWVVRVMKNGKTKFQMYFKDLELAGLVAEEARSLYHGIYAKSQLKGN
jgi:hypothetical protein